MSYRQQGSSPSRYYQTASHGFGKEFERAFKKLFDPQTRKLTDEALSVCIFIGINPNDLYEKSLETFKESAENEEIAQMRYSHFEQRRRNKLKMVSDAINEQVRQRAQTSHGGVLNQTHNHVLTQNLNVDLEKLPGNNTGGGALNTSSGLAVGRATFFNSRINRVSSVHNARRSHNNMFGTSGGNLPGTSDYHTRTGAGDLYHSQLDGLHQSAERMISLNTERDQIKLQKLLKIKENIESLAQREAQKFHQTLKKNEKRDKLAKDYRKAIMEEAKQKKLKYDARRIQAKDLMQKSMVASEQKGVKIYSQYVKDIEQRLENDKKKEKQLSYSEYETYKKKFETSMQNSSFYNQKMRENEMETQQNLGSLDFKLNQGFDRSIMHRSEKAQRASYYTEKIEQQKIEHIFSKYVTKRMQSEDKVSRRMKDNQRLWKTQRKQLEDKFSKIRDQQLQLQKEQDKKRKQILEKHSKENELHNEARHFIQEEVVKKREWSNLKRYDQQENLMINQRRKELMKERLIEKHIVIKKQLEGIKQQQSMLLEMRKKQDKERRKITEEIIETNHGAFRQRLMSQSIARTGGQGGLGGKVDEEQNKDLNDNK
eukprot:403334832